MAESNYNIVLGKLASMCSLSEKCESDALEYLAGKGLTPDECQKGLDYLVKNKYIDNQRFANAFANDKVKFGKWGVIKVRAALSAKKIGSDIIDNALRNIPDDLQKDVIATETAKKAKTIKDLSTPQVKAKLIRFCASRGYPNNISLSVIDQIINNSTCN